MYTFKSNSSKSNAKRFLEKTAKVDNAAEYLTEIGNRWGCYVDTAGNPVKLADMPTEAPASQPASDTHSYDQPEPSSTHEPVLPAENDLPAQDEPNAAPAPAPSAFGAFAMAQLTAPSARPPVEPAKPQRQGATPTTGLRIQKDRPEQNGVRRQSAGSVGDKLWSLFDAARAAGGGALTLEQAKALAQGAKLSATSAAIALYNWRKFHGIPSRQPK